MGGKLAEIDLDGIENVIVVGDLHGDFKSFNKIMGSYDSSDIIIFLGDYIDKGPEGVELVDGLIELVDKDNIVALKGNHEDYSNGGHPNAYPCTFIKEVESKKGNWLNYFEDFKEDLLDKLYIAAVIPEKILFVHGGISSDIKSVDDLRKPNYYIEQAILWNDPISLEGEYPSRRGPGVKLFGPDITEKVLENIGANYIIRSHEPRKAFKGPYPEHDGKIITTNSSSFYSETPFFLKIPIEEIPEKGEEIIRYANYI